MYAVSGTDLNKVLATPERLNCSKPGCFEVFQGFSPLTLTQDNFQISSSTTAILRFGPQAATPVIALQDLGKSKLVSLSIPGLPQPAAGSASGLSVSNPQRPIAVKATPKTMPSSTATCGTSKPAKQEGAPQQPLFLYTTNGGDPSLNNQYGITPPTEYYQSTCISTARFTDGATTTVKAIAIAPGELPSQMATARFYRSGNTILPVYSQALSPSSYKTYRFVWHPLLTAAGAVEWDLNAPKDSTKSGIAASGILNAGDSTELVFSGVDVLANSATTPITFTFDNVMLANALFNYDTIAKTLKLMITTTMTLKPGHKEVIMNAYIPGPDGAAKMTQILLPFDVTKR